MPKRKRTEFTNPEEILGDYQIICTHSEDEGTDTARNDLGSQQVPAILHYGTNGKAKIVGLFLPESSSTVTKIHVDYNLDIELVKIDREREIPAIISIAKCYIAVKSKLVDDNYTVNAKSHYLVMDDERDKSFPVKVFLKNIQKGQKIVDRIEFDIDGASWMKIHSYCE